MCCPEAIYPEIESFLSEAEVVRRRLAGRKRDLSHRVTGDHYFFISYHPEQNRSSWSAGIFDDGVIYHVIISSPGNWIEVTTSKLARIYAHMHTLRLCVRRETNRLLADRRTTNCFEIKFLRKLC